MVAKRKKRIDRRSRWLMVHMNGSRWKTECRYTRKEILRDFNAKPVRRID